MLSRRALLLNSAAAGGAVIFDLLRIPKATAASAANLTLSNAGYYLALGGTLVPIHAVIAVQQATADPKGGSMPSRFGRKPTLDMPQPNRLQLALEWGASGGVFADWVNGAMGHMPTLQNGSLLLLDSQLQVRTQYDWSGGSVSQVALPVCDASSTAAGGPSITIQSSTLVMQTMPAGQAAGMQLQRTIPWRQNDFRLDSNANLSLQHVYHVASIVLAANSRGGSVELMYRIGAQSPDFAPLGSALQQQDHRPLPGQSTEVTLQFLRRDLQASLGSVTLHDCRVDQITFVPGTSGTLGVPGSLAATSVILSYADASLGILAT